MYLRRFLFLLVTMLLLCGLTVPVHATLVDNGDGTVTQIRVDGSRLMWLKDANYAQTSGYDADGIMTFDQANTWIASINSASLNGYNDWHLPDTLPVNGVSYDFTLAYDGSTDRGWNITSPNSEMAYMYYVELGNLGRYDIYGNDDQPGWGLTNTDIFDNLIPSIYWSGMTQPPDLDRAWPFNFVYGRQLYNSEVSSGFAWAVRTVVPEPTSILLLGSGLIGLIGLRRKLN